MDALQRVDERYTSFENIDCFDNACKVIDNLLRVLEDATLYNAYWEKYVPLIPKSYYEPTTSTLKAKEDLLYFVCSKLFFIDELFDEAEDEVASHSMKLCEVECC